MAPPNWPAILQKYADALSSGKEVKVILKHTSVPLSGVIKEIDSDVLVLETKSGHIAAVIALSEVAALQTYHGQW